MAAENEQVVPPAEVSEIVPPVETPEAAAPVEGETPVEAAETPAPAKLPPSDYRAKKLEERVNKLTAQKRALEEQLANKQAATGRLDPKDDAALERIVAERAEALAETKATAKAAQRVFDEKCIAAVELGRASYKDFDDRVKELQSTIIDPSDSTTSQKYVNFIDALLETGEAHKLIYELGSDPEEVERIVKLSPVKQGIELAKLASKVPEPVSNAPRPITPIGSRSASHVKIDPNDPSRADNLSTAEWMARRAAQVEENWKNSRRY